MIKKILNTNIKRYCHYHSKTFSIDTNWNKVGEMFIIKTEIDELKMKNDELNIKINKLQTKNSLHSWGIIILGCLYLF